MREVGEQARGVVAGRVGRAAAGRGEAEGQTEVEQPIWVWPAHKKREAAQRGNAPPPPLARYAMVAARVVPRRKPGLYRIVRAKREEGFELAGGDDDPGPAFLDLGVFRKTHEVRMRDSSIAPLFLGPQG
jgi:hypothetical protein